MNIYAGNLSRELSSKELQDAFSEFGQVSKATVISDKFTGESKGFGFVEMPNQSEGQAAIDGMNGKELKGRAITVNEARPREDRGFGGGGGGRRGGGGGGFGGGGRRGGGGGFR